MTFMVPTPGFYTSSPRSLAVHRLRAGGGLVGVDLPQLHVPVRQLRLLLAHGPLQLAAGAVGAMFVWFSARTLVLRVLDECNRRLQIALGLFWSGTVSATSGNPRKPFPLPAEINPNQHQLLRRLDIKTHP